MDVQPAGSPRHEGSTRHELLVALRRHGPASPDGLAHLLGISRTAVLQQLRVLAASGLVERQAVRHGVGRPRHLYYVTPDARTHFPASYDALATSLLQAVRAAGGAPLVGRILDERRGAQAAAIRARSEARRLTGASLRERVGELALIQDEQGFLCELAAPDLGGGVAADPAGHRSEGDPGDPTRALGRAPEGRSSEDGPSSVPEGRSSDDGPSSVDDALRLLEHNCPIYRIAEAVPDICEAEMRLFGEVLGADVVRETHIMSGARCCTYRITPGSAPATV